MPKAAVTTGRIAPPVGPFSPAIESDGSLYLSGQVAQDPVSGKLVDEDVAVQTEQILQNAAVILQAAGQDLSDLDLDVVVLPPQVDEFTCVECFLVKHRSQLDHETKLGAICRECAA